MSLLTIQRKIIVELAVQVFVVPDEASIKVNHLLYKMSCSTSQEEVEERSYPIFEFR